MTYDFRRGMRAVASDLKRLGDFHPDSEPEELAHMMLHAVKQYNELEKKHNQLKARLLKLAEEKQA